jgi:hypothetical protein
MSRKQLHNSLTRKMETYPRGSVVRSLLDTLRLSIWTVPHPRHLLFFFEQQVPCFVERIGKVWWSERRHAQRMFGKAKPTLNDLLHSMGRIENWATALDFRRRAA